MRTFKISGGKLTLSLHLSESVLKRVQEQKCALPADT